MKTKENSNLRKNLAQFKDEIAKRYVTDTVKNIANDFGVSTSTLSRFLKDNNIKKAPTRNLKDPETIKVLKSEILKLKDTTTITNICKTLRINYNTYSEIMDLKPTLIKNSFDDSIVDLNNKDFCYLLGFFMADGHIDSEKIYICQSDIYFLHKIQKLIKHKGNINKATNADNPCYKLVLNSIKLRNLLDSFKIPSNKKLTAPYIDCGANSIDFLRGYFDGDGCLYYQYTSGKFKNKRVILTSGSYNMIEGLGNLLKSLNIEFSIIKDDCYSIYIDKFSEIFKFFDLIYKENTEFKLDRKYYVYIKLKALYKINQKVNDIVDSFMKVEE